MYIKDEVWSEFEERGYLRLGALLDDDELIALQNRIDEIMLGKADLDYDLLLMQLDSTTGKYEDAPEQSTGWKGSSLSYRKIQNLEFDNLFREYLEQSVFRHICERVYGYANSVSCFRAMFMNKPAHQGTELPWHQDAWNYLDRQPLITVWTALDPATKENGCVAIIPGSHKLGLLNPAHTSGFLDAEQAQQLLKAHEVEYLELEPGEAVLLHNWLVHSSGINNTPISRRAFSVCYMECETKSENDDVFTMIFDPSVASF